jgi:hypothetical protein
MTVKPIEQGRLGMNVAANVTRERGIKGMTYAELSRRLTELGRPIPAIALRRLENNDRRVDVDDWLMLALALEVSPLALLLDDPTKPREPEQQEILLLVMGGAAGLARVLAR